MHASDPVEPVARHDHVRGASSPAHVVIEYGDYDCPHTRAAQLVVDRLMAEHPQVQVVFRPFPLRAIHPNAEILARIAQAADRQGRFWQMHDHLMRHEAPIGPRDVEHDARAVGLDLAVLHRDLEMPAVAEAVEHHVQRGRKSGVHSTPTFFFDGAIHDGHYDYGTLKARFAAMLGAAR